MAKKENFDNLWTKLHIGSLRGNPIFRAVWRAAKVGAVTGALFFLDKYAGIIPANMQVLIPLIATALEKASRTLYLEKK